MKTLKNAITLVALFAFLFINTTKAQSLEDYKKIGVKHNEILLEFFNKTKNLKNVSESQIINFVKNRVKAEAKISDDKIDKIANSFPSYTIWHKKNERTILDEFKKKINFSDHLYSLVLGDINYLNKVENDVKKISKYVDDKINQKYNLNQKEYYAYVAFLSILKSSSQFWSPQGKGNIYLISGKGGPLNDRFFSVPYMSPFPGWKIVTFDAIMGLAGAVTAEFGFGAALVWGGAASLTEAINEMP